MRSIKILVLGLVLGVAGVVYAAGNSPSATRECAMSEAGASCCDGGGSSCCTGGSCCAAKVAKR